jgi:hypothetical protein
MMSSSNSDNFKDFFKDTTSSIVAIVSATLFIIFYIILKAGDVNDKSGIMTLQILSLISMMIFIVTIVKKFITNTSILQMIILFLSNSWEYIKSSFYYIFNFLKLFFINFIDAIKEIISSFFADIRVILLGIAILVVLVIIILLFYYFGVDINIEKIKQYGEAKKIIYSIFIFLLVLSVLYNILPKLYSSDYSPSRKSALLVAIIMLVSMLIAVFFMNEIFKGNYRNYGMLLFNVLIFLAFIYFIYGIKKFFFESNPVIMESYTQFEYFLYYYLFPICFFVGYILYYIYIYRKENLSYTDFSDYRVIIFNILTGIIGLYLIYQLIIKKIFSALSSDDSSIINFIKSVFKVIPCIFTGLIEYLIKNPSVGILSIGMSIIFISSMVILSGSMEYNSLYMILLYIIGGIATIAGIIKILLATKTSLRKTKVFELLEKTILGTTSEFLFIILLIFFIFFYNSITTTVIPNLYEKYILSNGKQVINKPMTLTKNTFISSYEDLFNFNNTQSEDNKSDNPNKFDYEYGLSFWVYFNSFTPLNSQLYDICSLGDGLMVKYNPVENTLYFMYNKKTINKKENKEKENFTNFIENMDMKDEEIKNNENNKSLTVDEINKWKMISERKKLFKHFLEKNDRVQKEGFENNNNSDNVIIYKQSNIFLQRWNNIIVNYYGGTLDIFINGKIVGSKINVVPYMINTALTIGMNDGTNGDICNLIYYKSPMSKSDIYRMYHTFKNKNPPIINKSDTNVINFGESLKVYFLELLTKNE